MRRKVVFVFFVLPLLVISTTSAVGQHELSNDQIGRAATTLLERVKEVEEAHTNYFDLTAVAKTLPSDPIAIRDWVATNTRLVPYLGSLKGGEGVLVDREGNSLDRALLLAALLAENDFQVRLSSATLTEEDARLLYGGAGSFEIFWPPQAQRLDPQSLEDLLIVSGGLPPEFSKSLIKNSFAEIDDAHARIKSRFASVLPAVKEATDNLARSAAEDSFPRRYWWVEMREGENWVALDLSQPVLDRHLESQATFAPNAVPAEMYHKVTLSVVVEVTSGKNVEETVLVSHDQPASKLANSTLAVSFFPEGLEDLSTYSSLEDVLLSIQSWVPVINTEEKEVVDLGFSIEGGTQDGSGIKSENGLSGAAGSLGGVLGGLNSEIGGGLGQPTDSTPSADRVTGIWLRLDIELPGREDEQYLRAVFDAVPMTPPGHLDRPSALAELPREDNEMRIERSLAMLGLHKMGVATTRWSEAYHAMKSARSLAYQMPVMQAIRDGSTLSESDANDIAKTAQRTSSKILEYNFQRWAINPSADNLYLDGPSIAFEHLFYSSEPDGINILSSFDIVRNQVAVHANQGIDAFSERLAQGVSDTVAESVFEGQDRPIRNTARLHEQFAGTDWRLLMPGDAIPEDSSPQLSMALQRGQAVLLPTREFEPDLWWEVNLSNGTTLGVSENGRGEAVEFVLETAVTNFLYCGIGTLAVGTVYVIKTGVPISERFDQTGREVLIEGCTLMTLGVPGLGWLLKLETTTMTHFQLISNIIITVVGAAILLD